MDIHRVIGYNYVIGSFYADIWNGQLLVKMTFLSTRHFSVDGWTTMNAFWIELAPSLGYLHYEMHMKANLKVSSLMYVPLWFPQSLTKFRANSLLQKASWKDVCFWLIADGFCSLNKCLGNLRSGFVIIY